MDIPIPAPDDLAQRLAQVQTALEGLVRLGQELASKETGLNNAAVADALLSHVMASTPLTTAGVLLFDESYVLRLVSALPHEDRDLIALLVDEAIDQGAVAMAIQTNRAIFDPRGDGSSALLLRSLGTRSGELGLFAAVMPRDLPLAAWTEFSTGLDAAVNLASYAFENVRMYSRISQQNQDLHDIIALRTKEFAEMARQAQEADRTKSEFLASMSHEIRTPLNGILGMLDMVCEDGRLAPEQRERLATVQSCSNGLLMLINDILDLAKIEARKLDLQAEPFVLLDLLTDIAATIEVTASQKGLEFERDLRIPPGVRYVGDSLRLRQVLFNLLSNAVKFTDRGRVAFRCTLIPVSETQAELQCTVADTGIGIPPEQRERVFEAFHQAQGSTTRRHGGTGLGLAISARLARLMSGRIDLESAPGRGSTFTLVVPLDYTADVGDGVAMSAPPVPDAFPHARVLVVEDNPVNQRVIAMLLERLRCDLVAIDSGAKALALIDRETFDVILMDIEMPVLDGYQTARMIREREQRSGRHMPIIALTAHAMDEHRRRAIDAGMDDYLPKPINRERLAAMLARHLPGEAAPG